jgi:ornithine cyclodeaminase/alanine dehydrogenase-like protein (mu-crystallin family)
MQFISQEMVRERLTYSLCITAVRDAMRALSSGQTSQLIRTAIPLGNGRMFGVMPGAMPGLSVFGAKLVSVFPENFAKGKQSHQGVMALFDGETGEPVCILHAGELTAIRTAAASAVATDALARPDASRLAILGYGEQALAHIEAINLVRSITEVTVWGRDSTRAQSFARHAAERTGLRISGAASAQTAAANADIICTVTNASDPILHGEWVQPGTHVNAVGSSRPGPAEIDSDLVVRSRFIADSRESVLALGAEFLKAKAEGLIGDSHIAAEIGEVLLGTAPGRQSPEQVTVYKSLGHIVQDLAAAAAIFR